MKLKCDKHWLGFFGTLDCSPDIYYKVIRKLKFSKCFIHCQSKFIYVSVEAWLYYPWLKQKWMCLYMPRYI